MRLLLVEDDELLGDGVKAGLTQNGYTVDWFKDGLSASQAIRSEIFDLVVLDLGLPKLSGLALLQQMREQGIVTPVLILTARETIEDRVKGLDSGADDYLTKPFDLYELCARLRALQRRFLHRAESKIHYGNIVLDPDAHRVTLNNEELNIPRLEFALLQKLLDYVGTVLC
jgi:two-component system response regulator QseB